MWQIFRRFRISEKFFFQGQVTHEAIWGKYDFA